MKFSVIIQLNAWQDWYEHYIAYDSLKKWLYLVEKAKLGIITLPPSYRNVDPDLFVKANRLTSNLNSPRLAPALRTPKRTLFSTTNASSSASGRETERTPLLLNNSSDDDAPVSIVGAVSPVIPATPSTASSLETFFIEPLDDQLAKIERFYAAKKAQNMEKIQDLVDNIAIVEGFDSSPSMGAGPSGIGMSSASSSTPSPRAPLQNLPQAANAATPRRKSSRRSMSGSMVSNSDSETSGWGGGAASIISTASGHPNSIAYNFWNRPINKTQRAQFRTQAAQLYAELKELQDGFSKILKKYEKVTGFRLKARYMGVVEGSHPFRAEEAADLKTLIDKVVDLYARIACDNDLRAARGDLESKTRQRITIERNTVWKDMVEQGGRTMSIVEARRKEDEEEEGEGGVWRLAVEGCCFGCLDVYLPWFCTMQLALFLAFIGLLAFLVQVQIFETPEQQNCFAIFVFASGMWACEVVPLFVTSAMVPFLVVTLRVMRDTVSLPDGTISHPRLDAKGQAKRVFADMFSPVIMLLLGGFSLGSAVSKHGIAKMLASVVLDKAGSDPKVVILANMFVSTFASMWISNVAAPALCFPLISPILRNIPTNSPYAKSLIMGIALAANVGGMASPIASPQNIIAIGAMQPGASWLEWFAVAVPVCIVIDLAIWVLLLLVYRPTNPVAEENRARVEEGVANSVTGGSTAAGEGGEQLPPISQFMTMEPLTAKQWYILGITFSTIMLWCIESKIEWLVGDMGVIALLPIIAFYGTGVLSKDDWNQQLWHVVMLAMGVGALIILPVVAKIGSEMMDPQPRMLVMMIALVCSGAMGLPVSSFPNMNAISQQDAVGVPYISVADFYKVGVLGSVVAWAVIVTLGYYCSTLIGFK
ncbi:SPX domain-containing protein [Chytriomyces sp. MP71]|nr:SPX domain-containing protein [Chytriomyces sp. MP71]